VGARCRSPRVSSGGANWEKVLWQSARTRAARKGLIFEIEISDIVIPTNCPVLGFPLTSGAGKSKGKPKWSAQPDAPSLDRIDSRKGYVRGNVWVISWRANAIKNSATPAELIALGRALERLGPHSE
jgi:hypothetical protein